MCFSEGGCDEPQSQLSANHDFDSDLSASLRMWHSSTNHHADAANGHIHLCSTHSHKYARSTNRYCYKHISSAATAL
jgi:hypothetical protein